MGRFDDIINGGGKFKTFETPSGSYTYKQPEDRIVCQDGESLSVQAGELLYSSPRDDIGPYYAVEVGYPSASPPDSWREYFDGDWEEDDHTGSVYPFIPVELVWAFIEEHGGEKQADESPKVTCADVGWALH